MIMEDIRDKTKQKRYLPCRFQDFPKQKKSKKKKKLQKEKLFTNSLDVLINVT